MRMMKTLLVVCFVLMVSAMMVDAKPYITGINWDTTCELEYPKKANDYHVKGKIWSANNFVPEKVQYFADDKTKDPLLKTTWVLTGYNVSKNPTVPDAYDFTLDFATLNGGTVWYGAPCHFGIKFRDQDYNRIEITEAYWTYNGENVGPSNVTGFHAWDGGINGAQIAIDNQTQVAMDIADLQVAVTTAEISLEAMSREGVGVPGTTGSQKYSTLKWINYNEKIRVEPKSSTTLDLAKIGIRLNEGEFLHARFTDLRTGDATWIQHQHKIGFGQ